MAKQIVKVSDEEFLKRAAAVRAEIHPFYQSEKFLDELMELRERWQDERDYESFEPYKARILKHFKGLRFDSIKVSKSFKIVFIREDVHAEIKCTSRSVSFGLARIRK